MLSASGDVREWVIDFMGKSIGEFVDLSLAGLSDRQIKLNSLAHGRYHCVQCIGQNFCGLFVVRSVVAFSNSNRVSIERMQEAIESMQYAAMDR